MAIMATPIAINTALQLPNLLIKPPLAILPSTTPNPQMVVKTQLYSTDIECLLQVRIKNLVDTNDDQEKMKPMIASAITGN